MCLKNLLSPLASIAELDYISSAAFLFILYFFGATHAAAHRSVYSKYHVGTIICVDEGIS